MSNNSFLEQLYKNRVLLDNVDCLSVVAFDMFNENISLKFKKSSKKYGFIFVSVLGCENKLSIEHGGVTLLSVSSDGEYFVCLNFVQDAFLNIKGCCKKIVLKLYGNNFECVKNQFFLPQNKLYVSGVNDKTLYSFAKYEDIVNQDYVKIKEMSKCKFVQTYVIDGVFGIGNLIVDRSGLHFLNSFDDFTSSLNISSEVVQDAIYLQDVINNILYFVYLINNKIFFKMYDRSTSVLSEEQELLINGSYSKILVASIFYSVSSKFFGVVSDGQVFIYAFKNDLTFDKVFEGVADNICLIEYDSSLSVYLYKDNIATQIVFEFDLNKIGNNVLNVVNSRFIQNVINVIEYNNINIYTSCNGVSDVLDVNE